MEKQLDELKAKMEKSGLALAAFEKDLDVINPEEKTNILSARLLQLNTEYTTAQAERVSKEAAWNAIQSGSLEAVQVSSQGQDLAKLSDNLNLARQRFALVKSTYGSTHPEYRKAASELAEVEKQFESTRQNVAERIKIEYGEALSREQMLQKAVGAAKEEWDRINSKSFEYQQLKQEADADKSLYDELIKKIREADINAGFQNNNIRIADIARPPLAPVYPRLVQCCYKTRSIRHCETLKKPVDFLARTSLERCPLIAWRRHCRELPRRPQRWLFNPKRLTKEIDRDTIVLPPISRRQCERFAIRSCSLISRADYVRSF
jgi:uncharacterized protein involved in exopolysaccharide biosynthesis